MSDHQDLLERARSGDRSALDDLLLHHHARLQAVARAEIGEELRARVRTSDILQSAMVEVCDSLGDFRGDDEDAFAAWTARILRNNVRDAVRYFAAGRRAADRESTGEFLSRIYDRRDPSPTAEAEAKDEFVRIGRALVRLPQDYRRILLAKMQRDPSHAELAEEMERSEGATRVLLARARAALLIELKREPSGPDGG